MNARVRIGSSDGVLWETRTCAFRARTVAAFHRCINYSNMYVYKMASICTKTERTAAMTSYAEGVPPASYSWHMIRTRSLMLTPTLFRCFLLDDTS